MAFISYLMGQYMLSPNPAGKQALPHLKPILILDIFDHVADLWISG